MENTIIKEIDGITHYVNPKYEKIFDGVEINEETHIIDSTFTPPTAEEIEQYELNQKRLNAKKYLSETDWYVTRKIETGMNIPSEILSKREQARIDANN